MRFLYGACAKKEKICFDQYTVSETALEYSFDIDTHLGVQRKSHLDEIRLIELS